MGGFSKKEKEMFEALGLGDLVENYESPSSFLSFDSVTIFYRIAVDKVFMENINGPAVESLRRCYVALKNQTIHRKTAEWDEMIQL